MQAQRERTRTETAGGPPPPSHERAALRAFRRAALTSRGYRAFLESRGVDHRAVTRLAEVPYTDKRAVFADAVEPWLDGGRVADAAELVTSSGQTGVFSVGVTSRSERRAQERAIDSAVAALGGSERSSTLLLNCLPMGIAIPTRLATVATPSVHLEMAVEVLLRLAPDFDRTVVAAEPLFLKELGETALRRRGPGFAERVAACYVGGEWVAESWRRYVSGLFGFDAPGDARPGILVSMGAAEVGVHALVETPALRVARGELGDPSARRELFGRDPGYAPTLLAWDPNRYHAEERWHPDGARTLVLTALTRRLLPLVRYDLDDEAEIVDPAAANRALGLAGTSAALAAPAVALWGRRGTTVSGEGWSLRPETVKEGLFAIAAHAAALTGRFRIAAAGGRPELHVQLREGVRPAPRLAESLGALLAATAGAAGAVHVHGYRDYPFHEAGDFQHKPRYLEPVA